jgi:hypothetical protein
MIRAEEFDCWADLPADDPAGDLTPYLDLSKTRSPGRGVQRVNVDFPLGTNPRLSLSSTRG